MRSLILLVFVLLAVNALTVTREFKVPRVKRQFGFGSLRGLESPYGEDRYDSRIRTAEALRRAESAAIESRIANRELERNLEIAELETRGSDGFDRYGDRRLPYSMLGRGL